MAKQTVEELKIGARVVAKVDLPGVPAGTGGRIKTANGFTWKRFWVEFDTGVWQGSLDEHALATPLEWENRGKAPAASATAATPASGAGEAASAPAEAQPASTGGVPAHLLERSRKARERLAAAGD